MANWTHGSRVFVVTVPETMCSCFHLKFSPFNSYCSKEKIRLIRKGMVSKKGGFSSHSFSSFSCCQSKVSKLKQWKLQMFDNVVNFLHDCLTCVTLKVIDGWQHEAHLNNRFLWVWTLLKGFELYLHKSLKYLWKIQSSLDILAGNITYCRFKAAVMISNHLPLFNIS